MSIHSSSGGKFSVTLSALKKFWVRQFVILRLPYLLVHYRELQRSKDSVVPTTGLNENLGLLVRLGGGVQRNLDAPTTLLVVLYLPHSTSLILINRGKTEETRYYHFPLTDTTILHFHSNRSSVFFYSVVQIEAFVEIQFLTGNFGHIGIFVDHFK